ncbi:hypothetical protein WA577_007535, partial [Blastocystis sp. JDR]
MRGLKTSRFDIEESSWNCDLSETVCKLLEAIPEEDASIDVPEVLYECLIETFGSCWCVVAGKDLDCAIKYYQGCMFTAYDCLKEESIIAFKPDTRRGNYTKKEIGDADKNDDLVFDVLSSSMPESIFTTVKDTLAYIIPKNPGDTEDVEIACPLRTIINRMNTGLYQVVVNKGEPIEYRIDDRAVNTLYMRVGDYYVLVWKLVVDEEMVSIKSRLDWTERGMVNVLWISIIFFVVVYAMYLTTQMAKNQQHCSLDSTCDVELLSSLRNRRTHLVVLFIVCLACYVLFLTYRRVVFRQRHLKDRKVFMRLLFGDKEE